MRTPTRLTEIESKIHAWLPDFPGAEVLVTEANIQHLDSEPSPDRFQTLLNQCQQEDVFGHYPSPFDRCDHRGLRITPPTNTFTGRLEVRLDDRTVELTETGPTHALGDLFVHTPDSDVTHAGDALFVGDVRSRRSAPSTAISRPLSRSSTSPLSPRPHEVPRGPARPHPRAAHRWPGRR